MTYIKTGAIELVEHDVYRRICDVCGGLIVYPYFRLEEHQDNDGNMSLTECCGLNCLQAHLKRSITERVLAGENDDEA